MGYVIIFLLIVIIFLLIGIKSNIDIFSSRDIKDQIKENNKVMLNAIKNIKR